MMFRSKTQEDLDQVRGRLAADEASLLRLREELAEISVEAATTGDYAAAEAKHSEIRSTETRILVARSAIGQLEVAEQERLAEARQKEQKAKLRAFKQHGVALQRAAEDFGRYATLLNGAWRKMLAASSRAASLVPPTQVYEFPYRELSSGVLFRRGETELARCGRVDADHYFAPAPPCPGSFSAPLGGELPQDLPTLSAEIKAVIGVMSQRLGQHLDLVPRPPPPVHSEPVPYSDPTPGSEAWAEREHARQNNLPEQPGLVAAVRGFFAPAPEPPAAVNVNPHPIGSEAHAEYQAALADIRRFAVPPNPPPPSILDPDELEANDAEGTEDNEAAATAPEA